MNYAQECLELDKKLAELLGWTNIQETTYKSPHNCTGELGGLMGYVPRWTQDDAEVFRLAVEYEIDTTFYRTSVLAENTWSGSEEVKEFSEFPSKLAAVRFAIVKAVVNKLQG